MPNDVVGDKEPGVSREEKALIARATILNEQLEKCSVLIAKVVGPYSQKDNRSNKAPSTLTEALSYLLYDARNEADELIVQLRRLIDKLDGGDWLGNKDWS